MSHSHPWMKFYPRDWRGDQALRAVSLAARGLWMECLMLMHEAKPYGHLVVGREPPTDDVLARLAGCSPVEIQPLLAELESANVYSRTNNGIIYSRRMTSDKRKADKCRNAVNTGRWHKDSVSAATPNRSPNRTPTETPNSHIPDVQTSSSARTREAARGLELECRKRLGSEPILLDRDFSPIQRLLDGGMVTDADVLVGVDSAMAEPNFRIKHWSQLVGWVSRAAKDRLAGKQKAIPIVSPATPKRPAYEDYTEPNWRFVITRYKGGDAWNLRDWGPPPGDPECRVPTHLLEAAA